MYVNAIWKSLGITGTSAGPVKARIQVMNRAPGAVLFGAEANTIVSTATKSLQREIHTVIPFFRQSLV